MKATKNFSKDSRSRGTDFKTGLNEHDVAVLSTLPLFLTFSSVINLNPSLDPRLIQMIPVLIVMF